MMRSKIMSVAIGAAMFAATAVPAFAVSIRHTNRAEGDPAVAAMPTGHTPPPETTAADHPFDKAHESGGLR